MLVDGSELGSHQFILPGKVENGMSALSCGTLCRFVCLLSRTLSECIIISMLVFMERVQQC
jgi:hypothetical protein